MKRSQKLFCFLTGIFMSISLLPVQVFAQDVFLLHTWEEENISALMEESAYATTDVSVQSEESMSSANTKTTTVPQVTEGTAIDQVHFPDDAFRDYVRQFDIDSDGLLETEEISVVKEIRIQNAADIHSLEGIKYFTAVQTIVCSGTLLTSLDLRGLTTLNYLDCSSCGLQRLDVSGCSSLETLWCWHNQLETLNVSYCYALTGIQCSDNHLAEIIGLNTTALTLQTLACSDNSELSN